MSKFANDAIRWAIVGKYARRHFYKKMPDTSAISLLTFVILKLDQFFQRRKMCLEQAHLRNWDLSPDLHFPKVPLEITAV